MAKFILTNTVQYGGNVFYAGSIIDDAFEDKATIEAAGGVFYPDSDLIVLAASDLAQAARLKGAPTEFLDSLMSAGVNKSQAAAIAGANTVNPTIAVNSGIVATNQNATLTAQESFPALESPGTNYVAQYAGGAPINDNVGPFNLVDPLPRRTVRAVLGVGGANPTVLTVSGTSPVDGSVITDVINMTGAGTYEGTKAFETITQVQTDVDPVGTLDIQTGNGFSTSKAIVGTPVLAVSGVVEAPVGINAPTGTIVPTTAPTGLLNYLVRYGYDHTHIQGSHNHAQAAHVHTLS